MGHVTWYGKTQCILLWLLPFALRQRIMSLLREVILLGDDIWQDGLNILLKLMSVCQFTWGRTFHFQIIIINIILPMRVLAWTIPYFDKHCIVYAEIKHYFVEQTSHLVLGVDKTSRHFITSTYLKCLHKCYRWIASAFTRATSVNCIMF